MKSVNVCPKQVQELQILDALLMLLDSKKSPNVCILVYLREVTIYVIRLTDKEATLPSLHSSMFFVTFAFKHLLKAGVSSVSCQEEIGN